MKFLLRETYEQIRVLEMKLLVRFIFVNFYNHHRQRMNVLQNVQIVEFAILTAVCVSASLVTLLIHDTSHERSRISLK